MESALWFALAIILSVSTVVHAYVQYIIWLGWTVVHLEGAKRKVFVGIHGKTGEGIVYPKPNSRIDDEMDDVDKRAEKTTFYISPFVRPVALVNPDRDEMRLLVPVSPAGAPSSTKKEDEKDRDEMMVEVRVSWSIPQWVPFYNVQGQPGDHAGLPPNLKVKAEDVPVEIVRLAKKRHEKDKVSLEYFYPGWFVVAVMQKYVTGEHIRRLVEFITEHVREYYNSFSIQELISLRSSNNGKGVRLRYERTRIRGRNVKLPKNIRARFKTLHTESDSQQCSGEVMTWAGTMELEPYGITTNDVTEVRRIIPERLVDASRAKEARNDDVESMKRFTKQLGQSVEELVEAGMSPDIAGLTSADSVGTGDRPGPFAALMGIIRAMKGGV